MPTSCQLSQGLREPEQHGEDYPPNGSGNTSFGDLEGPTSSSEGSWEESRQSWTLQSGFLTLPNQQHPFILSGAAPGLPHLHLDTGHCLPRAAGRALATDSPGKGRPRGREARVGAGWDSGRGHTQKGDIRGPGERGHSSFSSSSLFEVSLWFEFNFDFLNFSRLKLK